MKEKIRMWIAWHLPNWLVYWSTIRLGAYCTTGKYDTQEVPALGFMDALKRFGDDYNCH